MAAKKKLKTRKDLKIFNFRFLNYLLIFFFVCLCSCVQQSKRITPPLAVEGVLDLTNWDFERNGTVKLTGEYEFYWNQLISPQEFRHFLPSVQTDFILVPNDWNNFKYRSDPVKGHGFATYRLKIFTKGHRPPHLSCHKITEY